MSTHIEYDIPSQSYPMQFSNLLTRELLSRQLPPAGNLEACRERLRKALQDEDRYLYIKRTIERYDVTSPDRLIPVAYAVPCIMNMHNRVTEKIVATLFCKRFALLTTQQQKEAYKKSLEHTLNCDIFSSMHNQNTWTCPMTKDTLFSWTANIKSDEQHSIISK